MRNDFIFLEINKNLERIANALEENNNMIKDLGGQDDQEKWIVWKDLRFRITSWTIGRCSLGVDRKIK